MGAFCSSMVKSGANRWIPTSISSLALPFTSPPPFFFLLRNPTVIVLTRLSAPCQGVPLGLDTASIGVRTSLSHNADVLCPLLWHHGEKSSILSGAPFQEKLPEFLCYFTHFIPHLCHQYILLLFWILRNSWHNP